MIDPVMHHMIVEQLTAIEADEQVRILYACESGSRAWGFPSSDSDYDVRFIYLRPLSWYLTIDEQRDVIERPIRDDLDISGWDLKKALKLFRKSNPPLLEWLGSPIVYVEPYAVASALRDLSVTAYSSTACMYHYLQMARGNYRDYLRGADVLTKKYFYVLRPLLALRWLEQQRGVVPTAFDTLLDGIVVDATLRADVDRLLAEKRAGIELDRGMRIESISAYIEAELEYWDQTPIPHVPSFAVTPILNDLFKDALCHVWRDTE